MKNHATKCGWDLDAEEGHENLGDASVVSRRRSSEKEDNQEFEKRGTEDGGNLAYSSDPYSDF